MRKWTLPIAAVLVSSIAPSHATAEDANRTTYPIVFAHGMAGFDDIFGYDYWGDDYGVFALDPCEWWESTCNSDIHSDQRSYVSAVPPFHNSDVRGHQLAENIRSYMASTGTTHVNLVGHSQGGTDSRKAAAELAAYYGRSVVKYMISISSPHRGSPVAQRFLDDFGGTIAETLADFYGNVVYGQGNDSVAALKFLVYGDYDPNDGKITGLEDFNRRYPVDTAHAARFRSVITAQRGSSVNPLLWTLHALGYAIDGDGHCAGDCDGDGAGGRGDGNSGDLDDDGLVGINSQQMGYRLEYVERWFDLDKIYTRTDHGYVGDLNAPTSQQMTSLSYVVNQDHIDVIGVGPDTFDEMEFYAAITDYIADGGY